MANTTLKERLDLLMAGKRRGTKAALARFCKVKEPSVADWFNGKTKTLEGENLLNAAKFFNVSPEWLATGKHPRERFSSVLTSGKQLGESVTSYLVDPPSQPATLDPDTVFETFSLLVHDEQLAGPYSPRDRAARFAELFARVAADGGVRLTKEHNNEFLGEVDARAKRQRGIGNGAGTKRGANEGS